MGNRLGTEEGFYKEAAGTISLVAETAEVGAGLHARELGRARVVV